LQRFRECVTAALKLREMSLQKLSSVIGQMDSFSQAALPGHLHCRNLGKLFKKD
jgi:hypothetical protein